MNKQIDLRNVPFDKVYEKELDKALSVFKRYEYKKSYSGNKILLNIKSDDYKIKKWFEMNYDHMKWEDILDRYELAYDFDKEQVIKLASTMLKPISKFLNIKGDDYKGNKVTIYIEVDNLIIIEPLLLSYAHEDDIITYKEISKDRRKAVDVFKVLDFDDRADIIKRVFNNTIKNSNKPNYIDGYELNIEPGSSILNSNLEMSFKIDLNNI